ncbi:MAG: Uma2 family endonuclease [bacterium]
MPQEARQPKRRYAWSDYQRMEDDQRAEIIGGELYDMTPAPASRHQIILRELFGPMFNYFKGKPCQVYVAPYDVKLSDEDIVQPDVLVVCDPRQIKRTHVEGAPALVIEIISPSSAQHDKVRKLQLYKQFGVKEYWIVTPFPPMIEILLFDGEFYRLHSIFTQRHELVSPSFPDLRIPLKPVFDFPLDAGDEKEVREYDGPPYMATAAR